MPGAIGQNERAAAGGITKLGMAYIVENVPGAILERGLKRLPCLPFEPDKLHMAAFLQRDDGLLQARALTLNIHRRQVGGCGDNGQYAQGWLNCERLSGGAKRQVAHQRGGAREGKELVPARIEEQLPRQCCQCGVFDTQAYAQARLLHCRQLDAHIQAVAYFALKERLIKRAPERTRLLHGGGCGGCDECVQRLRIQRAGGFTRRRAQQFNGAQAVGALWLNLKLEFKVREIADRPLFHALSTGRLECRAKPFGYKWPWRDRIGGGAIVPEWGECVKRLRAGGAVD